MWKKTISLLILIFLIGCTKSENINQQSCEQQGYVPVDIANGLINLTNNLIDYNNLCYNSSFEHLPFFIDGRTVK